MKLTVILLLGSFVAMSATTYSQNTKLNVSIKNATLIDIFRNIEDQSEFYFYFNKEEVKAKENVSVEMKDALISDILNNVLANSGLEYKIIDRYVVVKEKGAADPAIAIQAVRMVAGKVTDTSGATLPGVSVVIKGTTLGTITDANGKYSLVNVPTNAILQFSFVGMKSQEFVVGKNATINAVLVEETIGIEEVVAVGYGIQKRATLTGAVSAIKGADIVTTKNENAQNMLTGKISGVRVTQKTSEPGAFNNNFDIRAMGSPLIIIDGIPRTSTDFQRLDPNDIDNMSVLKDASAAIYGVRAANGVVLVSTKKGSKDKLELNYSGSFTMQVPSGMPSTVDAIGYMTLRNEVAMHNINGGSPIFNDQQFNDYTTGVKKSTDWYPLVFAKYAPQTMHNLSATGGNDKTTYYIGMGYQSQDGFFKSNDLKYKKYNIRSNISTKITSQLTLDLNLNLVMDQQDRPYQDSWWIIRSFWRQGPQIPALCKRRSY